MTLQKMKKVIIIACVSGTLALFLIDYIEGDMTLWWANLIIGGMFLVFGLLIYYVAKSAIERQDTEEPLDDDERMLIELVKDLKRWSEECEDSRLSGEIMARCYLLNKYQLRSSIRPFPLTDPDEAMGR